MPNELFPILFFVVVVVVVVVIKYRQSKQKKAAGSGTAVPPTSLTGPSGSFTYSYTPPTFYKGNETRPPFLEVSIPSTSAHAFAIWAKKTVSPKQMMLGLCPPHTVSPMFDKDFVYSASNWDAVSMMLRDSRAQSAWKGLSDLGFTQFEHRGTEIVARRLPYRDATEPSGLTFLDPAAERLREWTGALSGIGTATEGRAKFLRWHKRLNHPAIHWVVPLSLMPLGVLAGLAYGRYPTLEWRPFLDWIAVSSLIVGAAIFLFVRNLSRTYLMTGRTVSILLVVTICGGVGLCWDTLAFTNGWLDTAPSVTKVVPIVELRLGSGRRNRQNYTLVAQSPKDPNETIELDVSHRMFEDARQAGSQLLLELKPGFFGFDWIVRKDIVIGNGPS